MIPPERSGESPPPAPRWVKTFGIAALILALLLVIMMVSGHGGPHSPLRHFQSHTPGANPPAAGAAQHP